MKNFLEEFGKSFTGWEYSQIPQEENKPENNDKCNNFYTLFGFFHNLYNLNNDKILKKNEYIIGLDGFIKTYKREKNNNIFRCVQSFNLILISNHINIYVLKCNTSPNQKSENVKNYNEIYKLELIEENNYLINDLLIKFISKSLNQIYFHFESHSDNNKFYRNNKLKQGFYLSTNQFTTNYEHLRNDNSKI